MKPATKINAAAELPALPAEGAGLPVHSLTTFQLWGDQLPIGILEGGELHRSFAFGVYNLGSERELAIRRKKAHAPAESVVEVLAFMLISLGPYSDFQALDENSRKLIIQRMWMHDVLYVYFSLRRDALGDELSVGCTCPTCGAKWKFTGDLSQGDVKVVEDPKDITWPHVLKHGLIGKDGKPIRDIVLQPPRWECMMGISRKTGRIDPVHAKVRIIASSIRHLGDGSHALTEAAINSMSKWDVEHITKTLDDNVPGPDMTLEPECPECQAELRIPINWDWDFFFGAASL